MNKVERYKTGGGCESSPIHIQVLIPFPAEEDGSLSSRGVRHEPMLEDEVSECSDWLQDGLDAVVGCRSMSDGRVASWWCRRNRCGMVRGGVEGAGGDPAVSWLWLWSVPSQCE